MSLFSTLAGANWDCLHGRIPGPEPTLPLGNAGAFLGVNPWVPLAAWFAEHGPLVLFWMLESPALAVNDPAILREIFETRTQDFHKVAPRTALLPVVTESNCLIQDGEAWLSRRLSHPFSAREFSAWLDGQGAPIREAVRNRLMLLSAGGGGFDLRSALERVTFDSFAVMATGTVPGDPVHDAFMKVMTVGDQRIKAMLHMPEIDPTFYLSRDQWLRYFGEQMDQARMRPSGADLTRRFLPATEMDDESFRNELANLFPGGVFSTTSGIQAALQGLVADRSLFDEVRAAVRGLGPEPTLGQLRACAPLRHALFEGMRLYPGAPLYTRFTPVDRSIVLGGVEIPPHTGIYVTAWALHRDPGFWGADAESFRPARWVELESKAPMGGAHFFPFGQGPRECLGKFFALAHALTALAVLVTEADWEIDASSAKEAFFFACLVHEGVSGTLLPLPTT